MCLRKLPPAPQQTIATSPTITTEVVVTNLDTPWAMDFAPDGRIFITERPGHMRIVKDGRLLVEPWITFDVARGGESGLLGIALDPQFAQNHFVSIAYTYRSADGGLRNRLVRLRDDSSTERGMVDKILVDGVTGAANHDGGRVKFGPDGKLYRTMGEAQVHQLA